MMSNLPGLDLTFDGPARYRIRVRGTIPPNWSDRLEDMTITVAAPDEAVRVTTLLGELPDQASLVGVLKTLYELHLPVLSVEYLAAISSDPRM
jgi:hypothetical protein